MSNTVKIFFPLTLLLTSMLFGVPNAAQENFSAIFKKAQPATVVITTYNKSGEGLAQGSGFFITKSGEVITNRHVIEGATAVEVKTYDGKIFSVSQVLAEDKEGDVARLAINIGSGTVATLNLSNALPEAGEKILVIGSPLGLEQSISDGIVSAIREVPGFGKVLQITAPISPGSSGGPVVNMRGEVVGIATFQVTEGQNINFAVTSERIKAIKVEKGLSIKEWQGRDEGQWLDSAVGQYSLGLSYIEQGDYAKALLCFQNIAMQNPKSADAHHNVGFCDSMLGRYAEAIAAEKMALRIDPDYAEAYYSLGIVYRKLGQNDDAIVSYKQAIKIKKEYAAAYGGLGRLYGGSKRYIEAIEAFKQAIKIEPDNPDHHCNLGITYSDARRSDEAIAAFKQAIRINPEFALAHIRLGFEYVWTGNKGAALDEYKILKDLNKEMADDLFSSIYK